MPERGAFAGSAFMERIGRPPRSGPNPVRLAPLQRMKPGNFISNKGGTARSL